MGKSHPIALRARVVAFVEEGHGIERPRGTFGSRRVL